MCATCYLPHKARDCQKTPDNSPFKQQQRSTPRQAFPQQAPPITSLQPLCSVILLFHVAILRLPATGPSTAYHNQVATSLLSANLSQGHYRYTGDLLQLSASTNPSPHPTWPVHKSPINMDWSHSWQITGTSPSQLTFRPA